MALRNPQDVFTPKAVASSDMFTRRNEKDMAGVAGVQDRVIEALTETGAQLRIFGDTGVGKTSLVTFAARDVDVRTLTVRCSVAHDFGGIIEDAIRSIQGVRLTSFSSTKSATVGLEAQGGFKFLASVKGVFTGQTQKQEDFEIVEQSPLGLLTQLLRDAGYGAVILDNFQNVKDQQTRDLVAQLMERWSDEATPKFGITLVVIGIADDAKTLLDDSGSVRRRTVDVGVPRMPDDEIREIIDTGFRLLRLNCNTRFLKLLVYYSDGFPFFAHALGLNVARAARANDTREVDPETFVAGMARCLKDVDASYAERIERAEESKGATQPRRRVLELLAATGQGPWTASDIEDLWFKKYGVQERKVPPLQGALNQLTSQDFGAVLKRHNGRRPYRYHFSDPHFRPFLRIRNFPKSSK